MSRPPRRPPNGISAKHIAVVSADTRPVSGAGIRSKMTAPRIGLMKPAAKPATTQVPTTSQSGESSAITMKRGAPANRNATR